MSFIARSPIKYRDDKAVERRIAPGGKVPAELVDDDLIACGAIEEVHDEDVEEEPAKVPPVEKPLARMNRAELDAVVAAEEIDIDGATTNPAIVAVIEKVRAERAQG